MLQLYMRNFFKRSLLTLAVFLLIGGHAFAQKIGTIDLKKVFDNYWKTKQADASIKDRAADMEKELKTMVTEADKMKTDYQALVNDSSNSALSTEEREKRKGSAESKLKEIRESEERIATFRRQALTTLDEQKKRMRDNILAEIKNIVSAKAKAAGYNMVIDTAASSFNDTPILMYSSPDPQSDLTDSVLTQLNATARPDSSTTDTKPETKKK